jgi:hypothetical protein
MNLELVVETPSNERMEPRNVLHRKGDDGKTRKKKQGRNRKDPSEVDYSSVGSYDTPSIYRDQKLESERSTIEGRIRHLPQKSKSADRAFFPPSMLNDSLPQQQSRPLSRSVHGEDLGFHGADEQVAKVIAPSRSQMQLMRQVSELSLGDPIFDNLDPVRSAANFSSKVSKHMDFEAVPEDATRTFRREIPKRSKSPKILFQRKSPSDGVQRNDLFVPYIPPTGSFSRRVPRRHRSSPNPLRKTSLSPSRSHSRLNNQELKATHQTSSNVRQIPYIPPTGSFNRRFPRKQKLSHDDCGTTDVTAISSIPPTESSDKRNAETRHSGPHIRRNSGSPSSSPTPLFNSFRRSVASAKDNNIDNIKRNGRR